MSAGYEALWEADAGNCYTDTGRTTVATNGQNVKGWDDEAGTYHLSESTDYGTFTASSSNMNSQGVVDFSTGQMQIASTLSLSGDYTVYIAIYLTNITNGGYLGSTGNSQFLVQSGSAAITYARDNAGSLEQFNHTSIVVNTAYVFTFKRSGSTSTMYIDGSSVDSGTNASGSMDFDNIMKAGNDASRNSGELGTMAVYTSAHDDTTRGANEGFLGDKYGITIS